MNQQQKKYLRELLDRAERIHSTRLYNDAAKMPAAVKRASDVIKRWEKQSRDAASTRRNALYAAKQKATETILFGTPDAARGAIDAFSKLSF